MALACAFVFVIGLFGEETPGHTIDDLPDNIVMMAVGMIGFSLFFPWFTALYFARHLLHSIRQLEQRVDDLTEAKNAAEARLAKRGTPDVPK